ncbi:MAG: hypothetical protein ABR878_06650 [Roseiarcus sp.]|jgi:hypothetical protein
MALNGSMKRPVMAAISALALILTSPINVSAQTAGGGAHVPSFTKLPDSTIAQFKANPQGLLTTYASAGLPLSTQVRNLVLTDPSLVDTLINVAKSANDAQKAAIGAGLAEAARILAATNPQLAAQIQLAVAQSGLGPLITAFIAGSNATETAAVGGGEGGGAGTGGPTSGVGNSGGSNTGSNPGGVSFGATNGASAFGTISGAPGGGLTGQPTSPSRSSI